MGSDAAGTCRYRCRAARSLVGLLAAACTERESATPPSSWRFDDSGSAAQQHHAEQIGRPRRPAGQRQESLILYGPMVRSRRALSPASPTCHAAPVTHSGWPISAPTPAPGYHDMGVYQTAGSRGDRRRSPALLDNLVHAAAAPARPTTRSSTLGREIELFVIATILLRAPPGRETWISSFLVVQELMLTERPHAT